MFQTVQKNDSSKKKDSDSSSQQNVLNNAEMIKGHEMASMLGAPAQLMEEEEEVVQPKLADNSTVQMQEEDEEITQAKIMGADPVQFMVEEEEEIQAKLNAYQPVQLQEEDDEMIHPKLDDAVPTQMKEEELQTKLSDAPAQMEERTASANDAASNGATTQTLVGKGVWIKYRDKNNKRKKVRYNAYDGKLYNKQGEEVLVDNKFVTDVVSSIQYISGNEADPEGVIKTLSDSKKKVRIREAREGESSTYLPSLRRITYNPRIGIKTGKIDNSTNQFVPDGGRQSPAMGLFHEMCHARNQVLKPIRTYFRRIIKDRKYSNKEERDVITGPEKKATQAIKNEATRTNHGGGDYNAISPTSTVIKI